MFLASEGYFNLLTLVLLKFDTTKIRNEENIDLTVNTKINTANVDIFKY